MFLQLWQILALLIVTFGFGLGIGRTMGESRAWAKMDRQETQAILKDPELRQAIQEGLASAERGETYTLDEAKKVLDQKEEEE